MRSLQQSLRSVRPAAGRRPHLFEAAQHRHACPAQVDALFQDENTGINFDAYDDIPVEATGDSVPEPIAAFADVDLGPALAANVQVIQHPGLCVLCLRATAGLHSWSALSVSAFSAACMRDEMPEPMAAFADVELGPALAANVQVRSPGCVQHLFKGSRSSQQHACRLALRMFPALLSTQMHSGAMQVSLLASLRTSH